MPWTLSSSHHVPFWSISKQVAENAPVNFIMSACQFGRLYLQIESR
jgi:hypothetical protein